MNTQELYDNLILGSVVNGSHRPQDIIPACLNLLAMVDSTVYSGYTVTPFGPIPAYAMEDYQSYWWDSQEAQNLLGGLFDDLDKASPEGYYFGAHPDDGSDFGYWEG